MPFELKKRERIPRGVRRIARRRIDAALETLNGKSSRSVNDRAVHETRKRFKEIRGTLRLVRDELGEKKFQRENLTFRDAGRPLSALRDAAVLVDTLDALMVHFRGQVSAAHLADFKRVLIDRRRAIRQQVLQQDHVLESLADRIRAARKRIKRWPLKKPGWKAIKPGLKKVYRQARRAMCDALECCSDDAWHEWRKRTKDLRYQLEFLQSIRPDMLQPLARQAHRLTDLLGEDHDLAVLKTVAQEQSADGAPIDRVLLLSLIDQRRRALQTQASHLGQLLLSERPSEFVRRLHRYWQARRKRSRDA